MKKWLVTAGETGILAVSVGCVLYALGMSGIKLSGLIFVVYFFAFVFTIQDIIKSGQDEGIQTMLRLNKDRLADISHKKQIVTCRIDGTEQTLYQSSAKMDGSTYFRLSSGCDRATNCAACKQCKFDMLLEAVKGQEEK